MIKLFDQFKNYLSKNIRTLHVNYQKKNINSNDIKDKEKSLGQGDMTNKDNKALNMRNNLIMEEISKELFNVNTNQNTLTNSDLEGSDPSLKFFQHETNFHYITVKATLNNTIISLCNKKGEIIKTESCGTIGFKKSKRAGYESAYKTMVTLIDRINNNKLNSAKKGETKVLNIENIILKFNGFSQGREAAFQALRSNSDWKILKMIDTTPIPHNGCRPPKKRRI